MRSVHALVLGILGCVFASYGCGGGYPYRRRHAEPRQRSAWNINPSAITAPNGLSDIEATVLVPIAALRDEARVVVADFTTLVQTWETKFGGEAFLYQP
jgi:hypothetical protein